jgi:hypothetical protein
MEVARVSLSTAFGLYLLLVIVAADAGNAPQQQDKEHRYAESIPS